MLYVVRMFQTGELSFSLFSFFRVICCCWCFFLLLFGFSHVAWIFSANSANTFQMKMANECVDLYACIRSFEKYKSNKKRRSHIEWKIREQEFQQWTKRNHTNLKLSQYECQFLLVVYNVQCIYATAPTCYLSSIIYYLVKSENNTIPTWQFAFIFCFFEILTVERIMLIDNFNVRIFNGIKCKINLYFSCILAQILNHIEIDT